MVFEEKTRFNIDTVQLYLKKHPAMHNLI